MERESDCVAAMRQLWDYLDAELTEDRMAAIRAHLDRCKACHPHYNFQKVFLETVAETRQVASAPDELRERVLAALQAAGYCGRG